ncbi:uroporphyrinogen decarboxylase family protein [Cohnella sp. WQ 127256]|uniref:uroporphyrinogen decarboxylase family protein n=1 Tax=Cohnella sp. WQ 127256 TaxID=2938790 RepID=UPI002117C199|nr:uroporphyrinogen decarboxylase family protein [Cohnella sp. WQ 127256]
MNRKERVLAALEGRPADRVPVSFWRHYDRASGNGPGPAVGLENMELHESFFAETQLDFIKIMYDGIPLPFSDSICDLSDLRGIRPAGLGSEYARQIIERAQGVNERLRDEVYTYFNLFSPFSLLRRIGDEKLAEFILQDSEAVKDALSAIGEGLCRIEEELLTACGCLGVFLCFQGAEHGRFSASMFEEIVRPSDLQVLTHANRWSDYTIAHFCAWDGKLNDLERWRDYPSCAVNWAIYVDGPSLPDGKRLFGDRPVLGGFDNRRGKLLYAGSEEEVRQETVRLLSDYREQTGSLSGLILGADCSLLPDFDLRRFNWVRDAAQAYAEEIGTSWGQAEANLT